MIEETIAESGRYASIFPTVSYLLANASSGKMEFFTVVATICMQVVASVRSYKKWFLWLFLHFSVLYSCIYFNSLLVF
jgi:hypothetical protein